MSEGSGTVRRFRGLRLTTQPTGALLAQIAGTVAAVGGVWVQFGVGVALIVGGVAGAALGMLREAELI